MSYKLHGYDPYASEDHRQRALLIALKGYGADYTINALDVLSVIYQHDSFATTTILNDKNKVINMSFKSPDQVQTTRAVQGVEKSEEDIPSNQLSKMQVITRNADIFSEFLNLIKETQITKCFKPFEYQTIFVPIDNAFKQLSESQLRRLKILSAQDVLEYHTIGDNIYTYAMDGRRLQVKTELKRCPDLYIEGRGPKIKVGSMLDGVSATITDPDIQCSDGIIHVIDRVLVPSSAYYSCT
jgi:uncharacterized surface protein with fasciclin (FAS1) repeats